MHVRKENLIIYKAALLLLKKKKTITSHNIYVYCLLHSLITICVRGVSIILPYKNIGFRDSRTSVYGYLLGRIENVII